MITTRRSFLLGLGAVVSAPLVVHASSLMQIRGTVTDIVLPRPGFESFDKLIPQGWAGQWCDLNDVGEGWRPVLSSRYPQFDHGGSKYVTVGGLVLLEKEAAAVAAFHAANAAAARKLEDDWRKGVGASTPGTFDITDIKVYRNVVEKSSYRTVDWSDA